MGKLSGRINYVPENNFIFDNEMWNNYGQCAGDYFIVSPFWKSISRLIRSVVSSKLYCAHRYSDYIMEKDSESLIRSKSFDLDQKFHHLGSTCIGNKILGYFLAFRRTPWQCAFSPFGRNVNNGDRNCNCFSHNFWCWSRLELILWQNKSQI